LRVVENSIAINCKPSAVIDAFLEDSHLKGWWGVQRSLVEKKINGIWATAWEISEAGIKYISSGVITAYDPDSLLEISNLVYFNPDRQILGPMKLDIVAEPSKNMYTDVQLTQSGYQDGADWDWYYEAVLNAWPYALGLLKEYLER
jgi:hypothetical protein